MQNNQISPELVVFFIVASIVIAILEFLAKLALVGLIMLVVASTFWALLCWNKPRVAFGEVTTPDEARAFVGRGCWSGFAAFAATKLYEELFRTPISENWYALLILAGYAFGSIGIGLIEEQERQKKAAEEPQLLDYIEPVQPQLPRPPYEYASWDDEEERR